MTQGQAQPACSAAERLTLMQLDVPFQQNLAAGCILLRDSTKTTALTNALKFSARGPALAVLQPVAKNSDSSNGWLADTFTIH